eukprot:Protomagalhaensia_wolfi_Nauph_80__3757@NODE_37_length_4469_cov_110_624153_g29_i0_p1_GENE_NODE_37_length_4469_cov_110_624153_g29_i0NODE_37_length_4469_cov_110_624153_g29_i0_p1_ORF_typecomplete_len533_score91_46zfCCCH/PF00642_24/0_0019zfCCCH/PF00642_24/0_051zfCCCH/PF00642_24/3_4e07zfCCCH_3/PF15663_5/3_3e06zfCCCH_3/PF15663_5/0_0027zfCCCH_4/PF18044_1/0_0054zfCCCH_4/PF18044_1/4_8e03zfCCCH_4/PF18044_1/0_00015zf_CCCH_4/PF18345_1/0_012zf_CCCH_4/PF18345_1/79zf_CCCH_4/PF18345_1/0_001Torus/PF16131_5/0_52To
MSDHHRGGMEQSLSPRAAQYFHRLPACIGGQSSVTLPAGLNGNKGMVEKISHLYVPRESKDIWNVASNSSTRPPSAQKSASPPLERRRVEDKLLDQAFVKLPEPTQPEPPSELPVGKALAPKYNTAESTSCAPDKGAIASLTLSSPTALLSSAPEWQSQFYRTKLCPFYVKDYLEPTGTANVGWAGGDCVNGDHCRFAHSLAELRPLPDLRKTKLCSSYTKKTACKNARCPFAHSPKELRTSSSIFYKVTLCNFYKNGKCWNGSNCRFAHGNEELRSAQTQKQADSQSGGYVARRPARHKEGLLPKPSGSRLPPPPPYDDRRPSVSSLSTTDASLAAWKAAQQARPSEEWQEIKEEETWIDEEPVPQGNPPGFSPIKQTEIPGVPVSRCSETDEGLDGLDVLLQGLNLDTPDTVSTLEPELLETLLSALQALPPPVTSQDTSNLSEATLYDPSSLGSFPTTVVPSSSGYDSSCLDPKASGYSIGSMQSNTSVSSGQSSIEPDSAFSLLNETAFENEDCLQLILKLVHGKLDS